MPSVDVGAMLERKYPVDMASELVLGKVGYMVAVVAGDMEILECRETGDRAEG